MPTDGQLTSSTTPDGRDFARSRYRRNLLRRARPQPRRGVPGRTGQMRDMLQPGRFLFSYGIFYPDGHDGKFEAKHIVFVGRGADEFASRRRTGGSSQIQADLATSTSNAQFARRPRSTSASTAPSSTSTARKIGTRRARRPTPSRAWSTASPSAYLLTGDDTLPRGRREGHRVPPRALCASSTTRTRTSSTGTTPST